MKAVIDGKLYDTDKARMVASDRYWDGSNWERHGRNTMLYKTAKGAFFLHRTTQWQGEHENIEPLSADEAREYYERLPEQEIDFAEAFGVEPEEA
ncbi:MAG: hypothetical protein DDT21_00340 [Syntrophomonadaceae bacterium]|nr:hypothetical protein [Bacillota bacterium]